MRQRMTPSWMIQRLIFTTFSMNWLAGDEAAGDEVAAKNVAADYSTFKGADGLILIQSADGGSK